MEEAPEKNGAASVVHDECVQKDSTVTLKVRASALHSKNEKARQYWAAIHALIIAAVEASKAEEKEDEKVADNKENALEEGEVEVEAEDGEVEQTKPEADTSKDDKSDQSSPSSSSSEEEQSNSAEEDRLVEVSFANGYFIDPSGEWSELVYGMDSSLSKAIDYVKDLDRTILGTDVKAGDLVKKQGGKRKLNGCFNCGSTDHTVAQCPEPIDRRRIAEAREEHERSGARYYENDKGNALAQKHPHVKSGVLSASLRAALGLGENDEDPFVRIRQRLGPPPTASSEDAVYKSTIAEEPILAIVNDSTTPEPIASTTSSLSEVVKSPSPDAVDLSLPYPNCKEQGSDLWKRRLLPICTCGTEERCLRADPIVPPARFSSEPLKASPPPPPLLSSSKSDYVDSAVRRSRIRSPRNDYKRDERQISSSSRADTDYSRSNKRFRSRDREDRRYSEVSSYYGRREADRRNDYYQNNNNYTPPVAYVSPSPVSGYAGYPPQQQPYYASPALDDPGSAGPRLVSYSQGGGYGSGQQQHPFHANPPYMGYPPEPAPPGHNMPPPIYPPQPPRQQTSPPYPPQAAQQSRWQSDHPPVYYG